MSGEDVMAENMTIRNMGVPGRPPGGLPALKRRRVFRIARGRERQRGKMSSPGLKVFPVNVNI